MGWWRSHWKPTAVSMAIVLATILGWCLAIHTVRMEIEQAFRERSLSYVQAFASSAAPWVDPIQPAMLQSAARFMLVGSAQYVQVVIGSAVVADERMGTASEVQLAVLDSTSHTGIQSSVSDSTDSLDIAIPLFSGASLERGYVRIGIDPSSVALRVRAIAGWSGALAVGIDGLLVALLWWLWGFRFAVSRGEASQGARLAATTDPAMIGDLRIDRAGRRITLKDQPLRLTPKQYALLEFLAQEPDRVFSEREIVENVWKTSAYADSKDIKQYVYLIRGKLEAIHPRGRQIIETVPGFGYKLSSNPIDEELTDG